MEDRNGIEIKVGDKVKIVDNDGDKFIEIQIGDICEIRNLKGYGINNIGLVGVCDSVQSSEIVKVQSDEQNTTLETPKENANDEMLKIGDKVKFLADKAYLNCCSVYEVLDIGHNSILIENDFEETEYYLDINFKKVSGGKTVTSKPSKENVSDISQFSMEELRTEIDKRLCDQKKISNLLGKIGNHLLDVKKGEITLNQLKKVCVILNISID